MIAIHLTQTDYRKPLTKVALTFTLVNYLPSKDLVEVERLYKSCVERASADISARAEISAPGRLATWTAH
jgi:hypothetical protein